MFQSGSAAVTGESNHKPYELGHNSVMSDNHSQPPLSDFASILCCPGCGADLSFEAEGVSCPGCGNGFDTTDNIPQLFWPNAWSDSKDDVTQDMKAFYEETPFPNYDDFDSLDSLIEKARRGHFAKQLDDQVPPGALILECGCGTGQLTNFLSVAIGLCSAPICVSTHCGWGIDSARQTTSSGSDSFR
jgi:uncharacterized protein YbaR (Trm112 family)